MDNIEICKICNQRIDNFKHFWQKHKVKEAEYWPKYYPRRDLYTKQLINFKNRDQYFESQFNSRENMAHWLNEVSVAEALNYVRDFLLARKVKKKLIFSPSQIELRSLLCPGIKWINENLGDYNKLCLGWGFRNRFSQYNLDFSKAKDIEGKVIFADTREQNRLDFSLVTRDKGMSFGDYRMAGCRVYVERKTMADWWGTFGYNSERFCREIERAQKNNAYLVVLIEEPFRDVYIYTQRTQLQGKIKASPELPLHSMREILSKYENIQFLFVENRGEASRIIEKIFAHCEDCIKTDLQYAYDTKQL